MANIVVPATAPANTAFTVNLSGGPAHPMDWVGLYAVGTTPDQGNYIQWAFMNGTQTAPTTGLASANVNFTAPNGSYDVRWFTAGGYTRIAVSSPITVGTGANGNPPPPPAPTNIVINGDSNTAAYCVTTAESWPAKLGVRWGLPVTNLASPGKYSVGVLNEASQFNGNIGIVSVGTNDMAGAILYNTGAETALAAYLSNMRQIITALKPRVSRLIILSPAFTMDAREAARYDEWVEGLRYLCIAFGCEFLDVYSHMKALSEVQTQAQFDVYYQAPGVDKYHLSAAGHTLISELF